MAVGSVGCKIATILRGETDFYISLSGKTAPKDWDMAAPEALLLEMVQVAHSKCPSLRNP